MIDIDVVLLICSLGCFVGVLLTMRTLLATDGQRGWADINAFEDRLELARILGERFGKWVPARLATELSESHVPAGSPWGRDANVLLGVTVGWALGLSSVMLFLTLYFQSVSLAILVVPAAALGAFMPLMELKQTAAERAHAIEFSMPWMLDLVILTLQSGAGLEQAMNAYSSTCLDPVLPKEIGRVVAELRMGKTRREAFERFVERCPFAPVEELARAIYSLDRLGTPIADGLADINESMRHEAQQNAEANAAEAADKMVLPLTVTLMAFIIVVLAPFMSQLGSV